MSLFLSMPDLTDLLGKDAATVLCKQMGGVRVYVPKQVEARHTLAGLLGLRGMGALCAAYGGEKVTLPNGNKPEPKKAEIIESLGAGKSPRETALCLGVTERWVRAIAGQQRPQQQLRLLP